MLELRIAEPLYTLLEYHVPRMYAKTIKKSPQPSGAIQGILSKYYKVSNTAFMARTASADLLNAACSSSFNL